MQPNNKVETGSTLQVGQDSLPAEQQPQMNVEIQHMQQQISQQQFSSNPIPISIHQNNQDNSRPINANADEFQQIQQPQIQDSFNMPQIPPLLKSSSQRNSKKSAKQAEQNQQMPIFWNLLNDADKESYTKMRITLSSPACKHRRHHSKELNREIVNSIKNFVVRNDPDDWKRALVTGIAWLPNAIAINTRQLRLLLSKCKSSINALFQNLGYYTIPTTNDYSSSIIACFPLLKDNFTELRKWTIRLVAPPDGKISLHQQQKVILQQHQNIPIQIIQSQQVINDNSFDNKQESNTSNENNNTSVEQEQMQTNVSEPILAPKCPVEVQNQTS